MKVFLFILFDLLLLSYIPYVIYTRNHPITSFQYTNPLSDTCKKNFPASEIPIAILIDPKKPSPEPSLESCLKTLPDSFNPGIEYHNSYTFMTRNCTGIVVAVATPGKPNVTACFGDLVYTCRLLPSKLIHVSDTTAVNFFPQIPCPKINTP